MKVQLFRIDDRLIHGQVVLGWAKFLCSKHVILCDNEIAENEWESQLYLSCVPADLEARIMSVKQTIELLRNGISEPEKTIILVKSPSVLLKMIQDGFIPEEVNVGGIHYGESRKKYLPYLFLNDRELKELQKCVDKGIKVYCQDVPNARIYDLSEVIQE